MPTASEHLQKAMTVRQHSRYDSMEPSTDKTFGARVTAKGSSARTTGPSYLRERFHELLAANPIGLDQEGKYVPDEEIYTILHKGSIKDALERDVDDALVEYVLNNAPKTFATLQLVFRKSKDRTKAIQAFHISGFTDDILASDNLTMCDVYQCSRPFPHYFPSPEPWDEVDLRQFETLRWHFLVPIFDHAVFKYEFDNHRLLPFKTKVDSVKSGSGYFGDVSCVEMLADKRTLRQYPKKKTIKVAHKTLRPLPNVPGFDVAQEWHREAKAHKQLNGISDHLVRSIAAYHRVAQNQHNDTYHLVLEWADGGNLATFMTRDSAAQLDGDVKRSRERIKLVLEQLFGLSEALECMHNGASAQIMSASKTILQEGLTTAPMEQSPFPTFKVGETDSNTRSHGKVPDIVIPTSSDRDQNLTVPSGGSLQRRQTSSKSQIWRHGDIKPENILRFTNENKDVCLGTLKLADLGRAQQHNLKTALRETVEKERYRTRWYEPPDLSKDLHSQAKEKISRLFDIWSMGCVMFECVLWLLYGSKAIEAFQTTDLTINEQSAATPYWRKIGNAHYEVTERASLWMEHILQQDRGRDSAIGDMVKLVRDRLLQVNLPVDSEKPQEGYRTNAKAMKQELGRIMAKANQDEEYLFKGVDKIQALPLHTGEGVTTQKSPGRYDNFLSPDNALSPYPETQSRVYTDNLRDTWQNLDDHKFVESKFAEIPIPLASSKYCTTCKNIDILSAKLTFITEDLETNFYDDSCSLCTLIYDAIEKVGIREQKSVELERESDHFVDRRTRTKMLRLCCIQSGTKDVPVGTPNLHQPSASLTAKDPFMYLPRAWLQGCDSDHHDTCGERSKSSKLPLRLVDVKNPNKPKIVDTNVLVRGVRSVRYIALSHKWGNMPENALTKATNVERRKKRIPLKDLPQSFVDAINITQAIGCDYLWIDSLCINQGPDGDFAEQADSMQTIFSNAYCVIAASSAMGASEGFLKRDSWSSVRLGNICVSAVTNDFNRDVVLSPLNRRGWVLQEHALARRTIFFTENQMYWECGDGVRCETLRKLMHDEVAFLGDPNFPSRTIERFNTRGEQIHFWTALFKQYTSLEFSHKEDRSVAIRGLMDRLTTAFKTRSLAGLFECFWGRCLLWQRVKDGPPLNRIMPGEHTVKLAPSWSWMAFDGPIDFLSPEGGRVDWATDVVLPFAKGTQHSFLQPTHQPGNITGSRSNSDVIRATAFDFTASVPNSPHSKKQELFYDNDRKQVDGHTKCVIIATTKDKEEHYVVLVSASTRANTSATHERLGVGRLLDICIKRSSGVKIAIG